MIEVENLLILRGNILLFQFKQLITDQEKSPERYC